MIESAPGYWNWRVAGKIAIEKMSLPRYDRAQGYAHADKMPHDRFRLKFRYYGCLMRRRISNNSGRQAIAL